MNKIDPSIAKKRPKNKNSSKIATKPKNF